MLGETGAHGSTVYTCNLHENYGQGWSQMNIASILGTTQSTISRQYQKGIVDLPGSADELTVDGWAKEIAGGLLSIGQTEELLRQRFIVEFQFTGNQVLRFDKTLTGLDLEVDQNEHALIRRLEWAIGRLDSRLLLPVLPKVGMNIAACLNSATSPQDVAAVPGKINAVEGELRTHGKPQFGSSKHLAEMLLEARKNDSSKSAIMNIRPLVITKEQTSMLSKKHATNSVGNLLTLIVLVSKIQAQPSMSSLTLDLDGNPALCRWNKPLDVDRCHRLINALGMA